MRKGYDGLYGLVRDKLGLEVRTGHLFLFANARRNRLKILYWDGTGLWSCAKTNAPQCPQRLLTIPIIHIMDKLLKCSERTEAYATWCISECRTTRRAAFLRGCLMKPFVRAF